MPSSASDDTRTQLAHLLQEFRTSPSAHFRARAAEQVAYAYAHHQLSGDERSLACSICEACARDIEVEVRAAISVQLCRSPLMPADLAKQLAEDIETVAGPVLAYSAVLSDDDLLAVIETANQDKLQAISQRPALSAEVGHELVERGDVRVVRSVLANPNAALEEPSLDRALQRYPDDQSVHGAMVDRPHLPASVAVKLIAKISRELMKRLVTRHDFEPELALDIARRAEDAVLINLPEQQVAGFVDALWAQDKLTPMLLLRALVMRQRLFFILAIARLTWRPLEKVVADLLNGGAGEWRALYKRARLPASLFPAYSAVLSALHAIDAPDSESDQQLFEAYDQQAFEADIVERLACAYPTVSPTNVDDALAEIQETVPRMERTVTRRRALN